MPRTVEQPMEVNVLDSSWTSEIFSWFKCVGMFQPKFLVGWDLGEIKMHLPDEDFSWSPTLKERTSGKCFASGTSGRLAGYGGCGGGSAPVTQTAIHRHFLVFATIFMVQ
ncbi:hypothetical protein B0H14DRAFT_2622836 [Mycena olivaceomarginata]|nr:hypothetical protein B0H14DRAFT_2622836 [Mycena olivaceomarginata]